MSNVRELESLANDLSKVIKSDEVYWRQNDAKFRALAQNATYDQFEEIVKASHLKPLEKKDKSPGNKSKSSIWNSISLSSRKSTNCEPTPCSSTQYSQPISESTLGSSAESSKPGRIPSTARNIDEFLAVWRSLEIDERITFLSDLGKENIRRILSSEIPPELVGDMLHTFLAFRQQPNDIAIVVQTLSAVTSSKRFSLSVQFMSSFDRSTGSQLIEKLLASLPDRQQDLADLGVTEYEISRIATKFNITTRHTSSGPVCK